MNEFKDFIKAAPKKLALPKRVIAPNSNAKGCFFTCVDSIKTLEEVDALMSTLEERIDNFESYLYGVSADSRGLIIKRVTEELIYAYMDTRDVFTRTKDLSPEPIVRVRQSLMIRMYEVIVAVVMLAKQLNIPYPDDFLKRLEWQGLNALGLVDLMREPEFNGFEPQQSEPQQPEPQQPEQSVTLPEPQQSVTLPEGLNTERARKYFARAVEGGYMEETKSGHKWKTKQARLGYFIHKAYDSPRPFTSLERYFNLSRLSASTTQASYEAKRADVIQWRAEMDKIIFFD